MKIEYKIFIIALLFSAILYTVSRISMGAGFSSGFAAGAVLALLNFLGLARSMRGVQEGKMARALVMNSLFRLTVTGILLYLLLARYQMNIYGVLVGLSILVVCIPGFVLYNAFRGNKDATSY